MMAKLTISTFVLVLALLSLALDPPKSVKVAVVIICLLNVVLQLIWRAPRSTVASRAVTPGPVGKSSGRWIASPTEEAERKANATPQRVQPTDATPPREGN